MMASSDIDGLLARITEAVSGRSDDAGIRISTSYEPAGGPGTLVFPPTYPFGRPDRDGDESGADATATKPHHRYAMSSRYVDGVRHDAVIMDSFAAESNRVEVALQDARDDGLIDFPFLETAGDIDAQGTVHRVRVTSLDAPHRGPDAYFRDSETDDGTAFDQTEVGAALRRADIRKARAYFTYVPTDLVFGFWDSQRGGRGVKAARIYTSEIVGLDPQVGVRGAVRFDPNNITKTRVAFEPKRPETFVVLGDGDGDDDRPEKAPKGMKEGAPSNVGHGNVPAKETNAGVSVTSVQRAAFISMTALSRYRFPDEAGDRSADVDAAARTVLASLALIGDLLAFGGASVFLRSGCDLLTVSTKMEWVGRGGARDQLTLTLDDAIDLLRASTARAEALGLVWAREPFRLQPSRRLRDLLSATFSAPDTTDD